MTIPAQKSSHARISPVIADLDARINAKESFASSIGLFPFVAGVLVALLMLVVGQLILV
ncbi:hypothetical protein NJC38_22230 [Pseudomonas sp. 21LCFQ010]|uniref:hypothetical protein n=1 Tax=Pseudomonas sp. 21LCFQ010 TaxID=2957506 RepID=UPI0020980CCF|nr:hypothetical protein [Pseudomonas sp. 21LCFQ010]MCO8164860.1 hypothetical protein [Pseudomonas sp. 21LCFQ010]